MTQKRILLVGAGAVGGITAVFLRKAGFDITVLVRHPEIAEKIRTEGIRVQGVAGNITATINACSSVTGLREPFDVVLLATKANDVVEAIQTVLPLSGERTLFVTMQNGICEDDVAALTGRNRVVGCVVGWGATMLNPAELVMTSGGEFVIGRLDGRVDDDLLYVRDMLQTILPVEISANIYGNKYSKLIINSCITSLGALSGLYLGNMLARRKARMLFIAVIREAIAVANAMQMQVEVYAGKINYYSMTGWKGWPGDFKRHMLIGAVGLKYRKLKSSSLQSLERGKPTEIDYLNGYIVAKARQYGVPVPVNDRIVEMIKEIESGKRGISVSNLYEIS